MEKSYTKHWKTLVRLKQDSIEDVIMHLALKAFFAKGEDKVEIFNGLLSKSFTPITNKIKLANGQRAFQAVEKAIIRSRFLTNNDFKIRFMDSKIILNLNREEAIRNIFNQDENLFDKFITFFKSLNNSSNINIQARSQRNYVYIFVDQENVEPIHQAVQAAHVAMVIGKRMPKSFDPTKIHYQICKKPLGIHIKAFSENLRKMGHSVEEFYEPDINKTVAIGTHPIPDQKRYGLMAFELLSF